jgi:MFS family permease
VPSLVGFRVLQSVGAAMVMATSLALLLAGVPLAQRARAISGWAMTGGVAAALGPPLGGLLVELSWRGIFLVNVPLGVIALAYGRRVLVESLDESETRVPDLPGAALLVSAVALLSWALVAAPDDGWGSEDTLLRLLGAGALLAAVFARAASTSPRIVPVLPLSLFRVRAFSLTCLAGMAFFTAFGAMLLGNVLWLTGGWEMSPLAAGLALMPGPALAAASALPGGRLGVRFGAGAVAAAGAALFAAGVLSWLLLLGAERDLVAFLPGQLLTGLGVGLTITNLSSAVSATLSPASFATGTATFSAARQLGATLGVALLLAVASGAGSALDGAQRGWVLVVVVAILAAVVALATVHRRKRAGRAMPPAVSYRGSSL